MNGLDEGLRESWTIEVDTTLSAEWGIQVPDQVVAWREQPQPCGSIMIRSLLLSVFT
jgi:hypothetical protein